MTNDQHSKNVRNLAEHALQAMDALLQAIEGGGGLRVLIDARGVLSSYVHGEAGRDDTPLTARQSAVGGVTLARGGQHFTINDDELERVREEINTRKREIRKQERRASGEKRKQNRVR
jgi:hypothetical protein